jgi:hypothetical protein
MVKRYTKSQQCQQLKSEGSIRIGHQVSYAASFKWLVTARGTKLFLHPELDSSPPHTLFLTLYNLLDYEPPRLL